MATEREFKFDVAEDFVVPAFEGFDEISADGPIRLHAIYWDTTDFVLTRWGHSVRSRESVDDASEKGWTVKIAVADQSLATVRHEIGVPGDSASPPPGVCELVSGIVAGAALVPVATIDTVRERRTRRDRSSGTTIEIDDDVVTSSTPTGPGPCFRQLEVEIVDGDERALGQIRRLLCSAGAVPETASKVRRVLAEQIAEPARPIVGDRMKTVSDLVSHALAVGARELLIHDPLIRVDGSHEAIHKARVATRRLRSDLKTLEPVCDPVRVEGLRSELAWLGSLLGRIRDLDVVVSVLTDTAAQVDGIDAGAVDALHGRLRRQRQEQLLVVLDAMRSSRYHDLLFDLVRLVEDPPLRPEFDHGLPAKRFAKEVLRHAFVRVGRLVERLPQHPPQSALHDVRKAAKRARYAAELVAPLAHGKTDKLARRLANLQDELGATQDLIAMSSWLAELALTTFTSEEAYTAGILHQVLTQQLCMPLRWRAAWKKTSHPDLRHWFDET